MEPTLQEGVQTKITESVLNESKQIKGKGLPLIFNIIAHIHENYQLTQDPEFPKRIRTVEDIIKTKLITGCTDYAHLFISLCKSKKIPALFVDVIEKDWIKSPDKTIRGHVFVKIKIKDKFILVDPSKGNINILNRIEGYELLGKGIDFLSMYGDMHNFHKTIQEFLINYSKNEITKKFNSNSKDNNKV